MSKYRVRVHGNFNTWYKIQEKKFIFWVTLTEFVSSYEEAKRYIKDMEDSEDLERN